MVCMRPASNRLPLLLIVSAALAGCVNSGRVAENPVENPIPALKPGVYTAKTVDVPPVSTKEREAKFPPELRSLVSGKAVVVFTVRADGSVTDASIVKADDVLFGESAVSAVRQWQFRPAQIKGDPVDCRMTLPFFFSNPWGSGQLNPSDTLPPPDFPEGVLRLGNDYGSSDSQPMPIERR